ncbi:MAG: branched-chain amino acid ABC transporter permease [Bdellovibrio sp.]
MNEILQHLINGLSLGSIYALIALGYTLVYGILQLINFAHADVYMMGAFIAYYVSRAVGTHLEPGWTYLILLLVSSMIGCALLGLMIERWAYRPLQKAPRINLLITAIGVSLLLQNSAQLFLGADPKAFPQVLPDLELISTAQLKLKTLDVAVFLVTLFILGVLVFFVYRTRMGRAIRAVSQNSSVAALFGISTSLTIAVTFATGSALAGVASVLVGMKYPKIDPLMGVLMGMKAFVAAVLGGIGHLPGAVIGGLLMGLSEEMVVAYLSSTYRDALAFGLLILILWFRPKGLFGKNQTEKV